MHDIVQPVVPVQMRYCSACGACADEVRGKLETTSNVKLNGVAKLSVNGGAPVTLRCDVSGKPMPNITWTKVR